MGPADKNPKYQYDHWHFHLIRIVNKGKMPYVIA
jgi:hypothetical protein